jgi:hypothetical protein
MSINIIEQQILFNGWESKIQRSEENWYKIRKLGLIEWLKKYRPPKKEKKERVNTSYGKYLIFVHYAAHVYVLL